MRRGRMCSHRFCTLRREVGLSKVRGRRLAYMMIGIRVVRILLSLALDGYLSFLVVQCAVLHVSPGHCAKIVAVAENEVVP